MTSGHPSAHLCVCVLLTAYLCTSLLSALQTPEETSETQAMAHLQGELLRAQSSLFSLGLEVEASQRSLRQSQRQGQDMGRAKERLHADLQAALEHREATEKHNQVRKLCLVA